MCETLPDLGQPPGEAVDLVLEALDGLTEWGRHLVAKRAQIDEEADAQPFGWFPPERMSGVTNPFATPQGGRRYHEGRPFHHRRALARILRIVGSTRVELGLDVACGTGLSTIALADIAEFVVGTDNVEAMVRLGSRPPRARFAVAAAEDLPFQVNSFDALTVSSGIHWFDQRQFFAEAARVLRPGSWLAIYDHFFVAPIDQPDMEDWLRNRYAKKYPPPPRGARAEMALDIPKQFTEIGALEYDDSIEFTHRDSMPTSCPKATRSLPLLREERQSRRRRHGCEPRPNDGSTALMAVAASCFVAPSHV